MMGGKDSKNGKYAKEIDEIRRLKSINRLLKVGDIENVLLSNAAKDTESMNETVLDDLLQKVQRNEGSSEKELEIVEKLITKGASDTVVRESKTKIRKEKNGRMKVKKTLRFLKKRAKHRR